MRTTKGAGAKFGVDSLPRKRGKQVPVDMLPTGRFRAHLRRDEVSVEGLDKPHSDGPGSVTTISPSMLLVIEQKSGHTEALFRNKTAAR